MGDNVGTDEDTQLTVTAANLLTNETDPDGDTLSIGSIDTTGTTGTVTDNGDGTFTYDPNGQFESLGVGESATDTWTYTVSDGNGGSSTATVTVTINGVNDAPVTSSDMGSITEPTTAYNTGVLISDAETPLANLTVTIPAGQFATGTLIYNNDGTFTYTYTGAQLSAGDIITEVFSYTVEDTDGGTVAGTVTVTFRGSASTHENIPDGDPCGCTVDFSARSGDPSMLEVAEKVQGPLSNVDETGMGSTGAHDATGKQELEAGLSGLTGEHHEDQGPGVKSSDTRPVELADFVGLGQNDDESAGASEIHNGHGSPLEDNTGLYGYVEEVGKGKRLLFNMDETRFADILTPSSLHSSRPHHLTGLSGYVEEVKAGKNLVFNLDEISCLDLCTN